MNRTTKTIHTVVSVVIWLAVIANAAWFAVSYHSLPGQIGCHFGPDGEFDVIAERFYGAYPYVVCLVICGACEIARLLTGKLRLGMKITERGTRIIEEGFRFFLDILKIMIVGFYGCMWSECVIHQHGINVKIGAAFALLLIILIPALFIFIIAAYIVSKIKYIKQKKEARS